MRQLSIKIQVIHYYNYFYIIRAAHVSSCWKKYLCAEDSTQNRIEWNMRPAIDTCSIYNWISWHTSGPVDIEMDQLIYKWTSWYTSGLIDIQVEQLIQKWTSWYTSEPVDIQIDQLIYNCISWYTSGIQVDQLIYKWYTSDIQVDQLIYKWISWYTIW